MNLFLAILPGKLQGGLRDFGNPLRNVAIGRGLSVLRRPVGRPLLRFVFIYLADAFVLDAARVSVFGFASFEMVLHVVALLLEFSL